MAKQYGLIIPGLQKKKPITSILPTGREVRRTTSIFDEESSDEDNGNERPQMKMPKGKPFAEPSAMERRVASRMQAKALAEDASIFQYDEVYDEIEKQRDVEVKAKKDEPKKSKYIERLLVVAERRKLENELRVERQVQKERELEGEEFKDKEKFVTTAYRKKLEEMIKLAEREKHEDYLEEIGDVTKQKDLDGFYRHLYEQKLGWDKADFSQINYEPIKSDKSQSQRVYRKRCEEDDEEDEKPTKESVKRHLENNIDADSDFSIDSSSDEDEPNDPQSNEKVTRAKKTEIKDGEKTVTENVTKCDEIKDTNKLENIEKPNGQESLGKHESDGQTNGSSELKQVPEKKIKIDIWKKHTVGDVFDASLQRYYQRKAARND